MVFTNFTCLLFLVVIASVIMVDSVYVDFGWLICHHRAALVSLKVESNNYSLRNSFGIDRCSKGSTTLVTK